MLSTAAIKTPQILMLSEIDPADLLSKHSIPVLYNNFEVERDYLDHFAYFQV